MMKLAWLCYLHWYDKDEDHMPVILFEEPERWKYQKIIPIVYAILEGTEE